MSAAQAPQLQGKGYCVKTRRAAVQRPQATRSRRASPAGAPHGEVWWHAAAQGGPVRFVDAPGQLQLALRVPATLPSQERERGITDIWTGEQAGRAFPQKAASPGTADLIAPSAAALRGDSRTPPPTQPCCSAAAEAFGALGRPTSTAALVHVALDGERLEPRHANRNLRRHAGFHACPAPQGPPATFCRLTSGP